MAKVTGPLLSMKASGTIAKTAVFGNWRGIDFVRQHVTPSNPRTTAQQQTRGVFSWASDVWKAGAPEILAPNNAAAEGLPKTGRNVFIGENTRSMRTATDLTNFIASPGARGGPKPASVSVAATATAGELSVTVSLPPAPAGWTLTNATAVCLHNTDPHNPFDGHIVTHVETASPSSFTVTGLDSGQAYVVAVYLTWQRSDGKTAYSANVNATGTPA